MADSDNSMSQSEYNRALGLRTFEGDGWSLTVSADSNELSAILGDEVSAESQQRRKSVPKFSTSSHYESDWADTVLERIDTWAPEKSSAPLWLQKATAGSDFALFQLSAPDNRWVLKFEGRILEPFDYRKGGWAELHELMVHGQLLDRSNEFTNALGLPDLGSASNDILMRAELAPPRREPEDGTPIEFSVTGNRLTVREKMPDGKTDIKRLASCADDFNNQVRCRLNRVVKAIKKQDRQAGAAIKEALHCEDGRLSFRSPFKWMTAVGEIPYDGTMVLSGKNWEIAFPDSSETLIVPDGVAIRAVARLVMCGNIACPSALLLDGELLSEFLCRPRHHKYFKATYRRPRVVCGDPKNTEVERAICAAMHLKPGWCYFADHLINEESDLHRVCGLPCSRITLQRAEALEGIRDFLKQQVPRLFFCRPPSPQFAKIVSDIEAGIAFARKQEDLLARVQPESQRRQDSIQKAVYRLKRDLPTMGDWTTRYDRLADHFEEYIRGGTVFQYTGPYRWKIEGISETPDTLDLAMDHKAFKRRKVAKALRKAKQQMEAMRLLEGARGTTG